MSTSILGSDHPKEIIGICDSANAILPTGSKFICPNEINNDIDIMVLVDNIGVFLETHGLEPHHNTYPGDYLVSCRQGIYNLLIVDDQSYFEKWKFATQLAVGLNLTKKDDRVFLFSNIIDHPTLHLNDTTNRTFTSQLF